MSGEPQQAGCPGTRNERGAVSGDDAKPQPAKRIVDAVKTHLGAAGSFAKRHFAAHEPKLLEASEGLGERGSWSADPCGDLRNLVRAGTNGFEQRPGVDGRWILLEQQRIGLVVQCAKWIENQMLELIEDIHAQIRGELPIFGDASPGGVQRHTCGGVSNREGVVQTDGRQWLQIEDFACALIERS